MTHDELLAKINEYQPIIKEELFDKDIFGKWRVALRAVVELPSELAIERVPDELTAIGQSDESFMSGYKYAMHLVIQAIEKELG